jgi:arginase
VHRYAIIEAPSALGHVPDHVGVARTPEVLLSFGLAEALSARLAARVESPEYSSDRDPETRLMNPTGLREYSSRLADAVEGVLDAGEFPVVLGGDCSILLGAALALRRRGRYGVLYIDGDVDIYQPDANPIAGAASASDVALATGRGPEIASNLEGRGPLLADSDVAVFAFRDAAQREKNGCQPVPEGFFTLDRDQVRRLGVETAIGEAVAFLTRDGGPEGFWIHLDADALDGLIMPAVDDPSPDGLSWDELCTVLRIATSSAAAVGIQLTIYNPDFDPDGMSGRGLAATVAKALTGDGQVPSTKT